VFAELRAGSIQSDTMTMAAATGLLTGRFPGMPATAGSDRENSPGGEPGTQSLVGTAPKDSCAATPEPMSVTAVPTDPGPVPPCAAPGAQGRVTYYRSAARVARDVAEALAYAHS